MFDVTFDESVTGLTASDLTNVGTATGCVIGAPAGTGAAYTVTADGARRARSSCGSPPGPSTNGAGGANADGSASTDHDRPGNAPRP